MSTVLFVAELRKVMYRFVLLMVFALPNIFAVLAAAKELPQAVLAAEYASHIRPIVSEHCLTCHSTDQKEGELDLERFASVDQVRGDLKVWRKVVDMLEEGEMPPADEPQPSDAQRRRFIRWARAFIDAEILASAGDPGHVVLRRLCNAEYNFTVRDLTGVDLRPARDFPPDAAAGEGFTNTGQSLVMSPGLVSKYLDAAKRISNHAVLLPDRIRFSPHATRREWTADILAGIQQFYGQFVVNGQGRVPLDPYVAATLRHRDALNAGTISFAEVAAKEQVNARYLETVWTALSQPGPSVPLDPIRARWRAAGPEEAAAIAKEIDTWRERLWKLSKLVHFEFDDKVGEIQKWQQPVDPLLAAQNLQTTMQVSAGSSDVVLYLTALDAGDGNDGDFVVWQRPRFEFDDRPPLLLRDVRLRADQQRLDELIRGKLAGTAKILAAVAELDEKKKEITVEELAAAHGLDTDWLRRWVEYLGVGLAHDHEDIKNYLAERMTNVRGQASVAGWGNRTTPAVLANASDMEVRFLTVIAPAHSIMVRPGIEAGLSNKETLSMRAVIGWRSPIEGQVQVRGKLTDIERGPDNGVAWDIQLRQAGETRSLAAGQLEPQDSPQRSTDFAPDVLHVRRGDLISVVVDPRDSDDRYDTTGIELTIIQQGGERREWDLAGDVARSIHAGNPHADSHGNPAVWHFYQRPTHQEKSAPPVIPAGSVLEQWKQAVADPARRGERGQLADRVQQVLTSPAEPTNAADTALRRELTLPDGPLLAGLNLNKLLEDEREEADTRESDFGLDPALFGLHSLGLLSPAGGAIQAQPARDGSLKLRVDDASLVVRAPRVLEIRLPAALVADSEFLVTGVLDRVSGKAGSVQLSLAKPDQLTGFRLHDPILTRPGSPAHRRLSESYAEFRRWFPLAMCRPHPRALIPVHSLGEGLPMVLFYREDEHLCRLMLRAEQKKRIDALWDELRYVSQDALRISREFDVILEYVSQNGQSSVDKIQPLREPIRERAAALERWLKASEPKHLDAVLRLAPQALRRPLTENENVELRELYRGLRDEQELSHEESIRALLARVLVSPSFLYRIEQPAPGHQAQPVSDWELATRMSYFIWVSMPDDQLREAAAASRLSETKQLEAHTRRMLKDARARRLAIHFACQWLHIRGFDELEKSEQHFPTFAALKDDMYEESILFFTDLFQNDRSVLSILNADHTFLNQELAAHYGIPWPSSPTLPVGENSPVSQASIPDAKSGVALPDPESRAPDLRRVDGVGRYGRGGILAQGTMLAKQSGASRTSPILRGNWVYETLLGKKLPRPPPNVPQLPDTVPEGLSERQLTEQHSSVPECAKCHVRIDPFGFALENFDAIGRFREQDTRGRKILAQTTLDDGTTIEAIDGLRNYLLSQHPKQQFLRVFCRKLLGYAIGRAIVLSDEPLLDTMLGELEANDYRVSSAVLTIVKSEQFQRRRGMDATRENK